eukprot:UN05352
MSYCSFPRSIFISVQNTSSKTAQSVDTCWWTRS